MSILYIKNNNEDSFSAWNKKIVYDYDSDNPNYSNLMDFNFGEKFFYGRVSAGFVPIRISTPSIMLKNFNGSLIEGQGLSAVHFVVDAFQEMAQQFENSIAKGNLYSNDPFLSSLRVYKAYTDPMQLYAEHLGNYMNAIVDQFRSQEILVQNFEQFLKYFTELVLESGPRFPFTLPAFMKSKYCPINATGLAIEIADLDYFNDDQKIENFINSRNWEFFLNACSTYGFMVDKNIPWRIVADIGSNEMMQYSATYGMGGTGQILNTVFGRADMPFLTNFRSYLLNLYNMVRLERVPIKRQCAGSTIVTYELTVEYKIEDIERILSDDDLLGLYFDIRIAEDPNEFEPAKKKQIIRECFSLKEGRNINLAVGRFEEIINKPFDYRGSLSYIYRQSKMGIGREIVFSKPR